MIVVRVDGAVDVDVLRDRSAHHLLLAVEIFLFEVHLDGALDDVRFCVLRLMIGPLLEVLGQCAILVSLDKGLCHEMV